MCSFHASPDGKWGMVGSVVVGDINYEDYTNFSKKDVVSRFTGNVRHVPDTYETIQDAINFQNPIIDNENNENADDKKKDEE